MNCLIWRDHFILFFFDCTEMREGCLCHCLMFDVEIPF
jgi:hypothetical protein